MSSRYPEMCMCSGIYFSYSRACLCFSLGWRIQETWESTIWKWRLKYRSLLICLEAKDSDKKANFHVTLKKKKVKKRKKSTCNTNWKMVHFFFPQQNWLSMFLPFCPMKTFNYMSWRKVFIEYYISLKSRCWVTSNYIA